MLTENSSDMAMIFCKSGMDCALSHLDTACRETDSFSASSSWESPSFLRSSMILSANIMFDSSCNGMVLLCPILQLPATKSSSQSVNRRLRRGVFSEIKTGYLLLR